MVTRMREKGQITIPANIRESLHLSRDSVLSVARIGDGILLTPKPSVFESVSAKFSQAAKTKGITLESLLKGLKKIRHKES
jgi:AbrB family looped-hinge helix DNA binding protein